MINSKESKSYILDELLDLKNIFYSSFGESHNSEWINKIDETIKNIKDYKESQLEKTLDKFTMELRALLLQRGQRIVNSHLKSPPEDDETYLPSGEKLKFSYERDIRPTILEQRAESYRDIPDYWSHKSILFSSGMAAIATLFQSYFSMSRPTKENPLYISSWSDYFETRMLKNIYSSDIVNIEIHKEEEKFLKSVSNADVFFIEPIRYNWEMEVINLNGFINTLKNESKRGIKLIIIDTTLNGETLDFHMILNELKSIPDLIVVQLNSILKLDQQGLELSNGGLMSIYTYTENSSAPNATDLTKYICSVRTILGNSLTFEEIAILDNNFVFNRKWYNKYSMEIFKNNAELASKILAGGIFKKVVHPSLFSNEGWAYAPFVILHLKEDTLENHSFLTEVIKYEVEKVGLNFHYGSSFGFRNHRYEVVIPDLSTKKGLFKVAMGKRKGPTFNFIIELLTKLSMYSDFEKFKNDYFHIKGTSLKIENFQD